MKAEILGLEKNSRCHVLYISDLEELPLSETYVREICLACAEISLSSTGNLFQCLASLVTVTFQLIHDVRKFWPSEFLQL